MGHLDLSLVDSSVSVDSVGEDLFAVHLLGILRVTDFDCSEAMVGCSGRGVWILD